MKFEHKETFSNFFYPIVGVVGYLVHLNPVFLINSLQMGFGSFLFHKYKATNPDAYKADWFSINLMLNINTAMLLNTTWAWVLLGLVTMLYYVFVGKTGSVVKEVALSAVPLVMVLFYTKGLGAFVPLGIFGLAFIIRKLDKGEDQSTHHDSWGHSVWHLLTAINQYLIIYI